IFCFRKGICRTKEFIVHAHPKILIHGRKCPIQQGWDGTPSSFMIYDLMGSTDGQTWVTIKSQHEIGVSRPHEYIALDEPKTLRYIKLVNIHMAYNGKFAIRAIRVFGKKGDTIPQRVTHITIKREENDSRNVKIQWQPAEGA